MLNIVFSNKINALPTILKLEWREQRLIIIIKTKSFNVNVIYAYAVHYFLIDDITRNLSYLITYTLSAYLVTKINIKVSAGDAESVVFIALSIRCTRCTSQTGPLTTILLKGAFTYLDLEMYFLVDYCLHINRDRIKVIEVPLQTQ